MQLRSRPVSVLTVRDNWKHLRVPFQLTLAPIFLWGYVLAGQGWSWRLIPAFAAFHFLLYTGVTAYNSSFDRDEGSIGGLERPPSVHDFLRPLAIALQAAGFAIAIPLGVPFALAYLGFGTLSVLYSHPRYRWKADPWRSLAVVSIGQGGLGFLAGWAAAAPDLSAFSSAHGLLGISAAAFTVLGIYPITQVYQIEEDRRRGDRTICVALGAARGIRVSQFGLRTAGILAAVLAMLNHATIDAAILIASYAALISAAAWISRRAESGDSRSLFRSVLALNYASAVAYGLFILLRVTRW